MFDMRKLDPDDRRPPYLQVAEALRADIDAGVFAPGEKLPSHQDLVSHFGVAAGTVKRALGELQGAGLIVSRQGQGAFVRTNRAGSDGGTASELAELRQAVAELSDRVQAVERRLAEL
jgi:DNA-binding GntR family transcriptional regulator